MAQVSTRVRARPGKPKQAHTDSAMFDIGFTELLLVAIVGLTVIGPERLPGTIRQVSSWHGKLKRSFYQIKADVEKELGVDEVAVQIRSDSITQSFEKSKKQLEVLDAQSQSPNIDLLDSLAVFEQKPS